MQSILSRLVCASCLLLVFGSAVFGQEPAVGVMAYMEGTVDVNRGGAILDRRDVCIGLEIAEYDLVRTGKSGAADVDLTTPAKRGVSIHVGPDTAFYFNVRAMKDERRTTIRMLLGSLKLKVSRLFGNESVTVRTESATLGVRGTEFSVVTAPDGAMLLTCTEGEVVATDGEGDRQTAVPGRAVEKAGAGLREISVPVSALDDYSAQWLEEREAVFKAGADTFVRSYAVRFLRMLERYQSAYKALSRHRQIFDSWEAASDADDAVPRADAVRDRMAVTPAVMEMRSVFPVFEQVFYRLTVLSRYHEQGIGVTTIDTGLSSGDFFQTFDAVAEAYRGQFAQVRHYFKLFARSDPFGENGVMEEMFSGGGGAR